MFNCKIIINILCLIFIVKASSDEGYRGSNNFDVLIFTQRWPQTVCYTWKASSPSHTCSLPKKHDEWAIHGIWPSQYHNVGPQFCNKSMPFKPHDLESLKEKLQEKWIDVEYGRTSYSLWEHEWNKHGTCAVVLKQLNSEIKYFTEGLNLLAKYDMKNVLAKANIVPGRKYSTTAILNAMRQVLGKRGAVICRENKNTGESYMLEIRICFNKMLQLINCDGISEYPTNCDASKLITYPSTVPRYNVIQV